MGVKTKGSFPFIFFVISIIGTTLWLAFITLIQALSLPFIFWNIRAINAATIAAIILGLLVPLLMTGISVYFWQHGSWKKVLFYSLFTLCIIFGEIGLFFLKTTIENRQFDRQRNYQAALTPNGAMHQFYIGYIDKIDKYDKSYKNADEASIRQDYLNNNQFVTDTFKQKINNEDLNYSCNLNSVIRSPGMTFKEDLGSVSGNQAQAFFRYGKNQVSENQIEVNLELINGEWKIVDTQCK